jgi:nicotinamide riboside kinase
MTLARGRPPRHHLLHRDLGRIVEIFGPESSGKTTGEAAVWNRLVFTSLA